MGGKGGWAFRRLALIVRTTTAEPGSVHVEFYTVDLQSAELWRSILCKRVTNRAVRERQNKLRKQLGITEAEVRRAIRDQTGYIL